jgi:hypothetical protein
VPPSWTGGFPAPASHGSTRRPGAPASRQRERPDRKSGPGMGTKQGSPNWNEKAAAS